MKSEEKTTQRLNQLESALAYLQNDYDQLNEAVLENSKRLEQVKLALDRISARLESSDSEPDRERKPEDETPPHY